MSEEKLFTIACPHCRTEYRVRPEIAGKRVACKRCSKTFLAAHANSPLSQQANIGMLAVKYNLISQEQLNSLIDGITSAAGPDALESALLEKGFLTVKQIETLKLTDLFRKASTMSQKLGALAVEKGMITEADLKAALEQQVALFKETKTVHFIKDLLFEKGLLSKADQDELIAAMSPSTPSPAAPPEAVASPPSPAAPPETAASPPPPAEEAPREEPLSPEEALRHYELILADDRMGAFLQPKTSETPTVPVAAVYSLLRLRGVIHGVVPEAELSAYLTAPKNPETPFLAAKGTPPSRGTDASIIYHFVKDQKIGTIDSHGIIDFKDKGEIPFVKQGALLMEKIPGSPGLSGTDVAGNVLPPAPQQDLKLLVGSGVDLSDDKLKVYAKADGQPKISIGGRISVVSDLVIAGDVDLKSGHIDFEGDVKIAGTIQSGFRVKGANIIAKEIMAAEIVAKGTVTVSDGVMGATIKAQGDIKAKYIKHSNLSTFGDVIAEKEITDSTIDTSGACRLLKGKIIASEISAKQGIETVDIGTELSMPSKLTVGVDDHVEAEMEGIENAIARRAERFDEMMRRLEANEAQQQEMHKKIADLAQIQDRSLVEQRSLKKEVEGLSASDDADKRSELEAKIIALGRRAADAEDSLGELFHLQDKLTQDSEGIQGQADQVQDDVQELKHEMEAIRHWAASQKRAAVVKATGSVMQGTVISGPHSRSITKETYRNVILKEVKNTDPDSIVDWEIKIQNK